MLKPMLPERLTAQTYGRYEKGERTPDREALFSSAQFFGATMEYLLGVYADAD